jgi:predicted Zn-dependent peptidase
MEKQGVYYNFSTRDDMTQYWVNGLQPSVTEFLSFVATSLKEKAYKSAHHEIELKRITDEMRGYLGNPRTLEPFLVRRNRPADLLMSQWTGGMPETLAHITLDDIRDWHDRSHTTDNGTFITVGNVSHATAREMAFDLFGHLPRGKRFEQIPSVFPSGIDARETAFFRPDDVAVKIHFLVHAAPIMNANIRIFIDFMRNRLRAGVENEIGLYHYGFGSNPVDNEHIIASLNFATGPDKVREGVLRTMRLMREGLRQFTSQDFQTFKQQQETQYRVNTARSNNDLATRADMMLDSYGCHGDPAYHVRYLERLAQTRYEDVKTAMANLLSNCIEISYVGAQQDNYPTRAEIGDALGATKSEILQPSRAKAPRLSL